VRRLLAAGTLIALGTASLAGADSITPVQLTVGIAPVARLHRPLELTVSVQADPSVLDTRTAPLRIRAKLATECGGVFADTPGTVLLDKRLSPQPAYGKAYTGTATARGKPSAYGVQSVCVYLEEEGDDRQFATDTSWQVDVSRACTVRAVRYDRSVHALARARRHRRAVAHRPRELARALHAVARARRTVAKDRRAARRACGPGVPL
jgi:hypothetical protein